VLVSRRDGTAGVLERPVSYSVCKGVSDGQPRQARQRGAEAEEEQTGPREITVPTQSSETRGPEYAAGARDRSTKLKTARHRRQVPHGLV